MSSEATDGFEAVRCVRDHEPDLVLMDLTMPRKDGLEALREIKSSWPHVKVMVLTVHQAEAYVFEALQAGADGYVLKDATLQELCLGVRSVLAGHRYISPEVSGKVVAAYVGQNDPPTLHAKSADLTHREREVLKLVAEGHRNQDVGELLCISERTVEKHRTSLMRKLGLRGTQELITYAIGKGLITP